MKLNKQGLLNRAKEKQLMQDVRQIVPEMHVPDKVTAKVPLHVKMFPFLDKNYAQKQSELRRKQRLRSIPRREPSIIKVIHERPIVKEAVPYNLHKAPPFFSFARLGNWWRARSESTIVLINMELNNGFHRQFTINEKEGSFLYKGKQYIFDLDLKYWNIDAKLYCYDFHEDYIMPIKRLIPIQAIKKYVSSSGIIEVEYATNPALLPKFLDSKIIEAIMKGAALDEWLKQIRVMIIIAMIVGILHLVLFVFKSGMLSQIHIPGLF